MSEPAPGRPMVNATEPAEPAKVFRRHVIYLSGFDPQGPGHYHTLFVHEGAKQAAVAGYRLETGPRQRVDRLRSAWDVTMRMPDGVSQTRYEFFRWDDIVRQHWPRGRLGVVRATLRATWHMWRNGVMKHTLLTSWPMFTAANLPAALILGLLMVVPLELLAAFLMAQTHGAIVGGSMLCLMLAVTLKLAHWAEQRNNMAWLMRSFDCLVRQGQGEMPDLEDRLDRCAAHIADCVRSTGADEVLVVGHSSGAMLAMSATARALRQLAHEGVHSNRLSLLTLGQCSLLLSAQPEAQAYRSELHTLLTAPALCWIDYGAPPDGCAAALVDPTWPVHTGATGERPPKLLNPQFARGFDPRRYETIRRDKFRCHFQYLMASERPGALDFFALVAGNLSLNERHALRTSVKDFRRFQMFGGPRR